MKKMLEQLGLEPGRIRLEWVSAAEGDKFARVVTEFTEEVRALGPLGWNTHAGRAGGCRRGVVRPRRGGGAGMNSPRSEAMERGAEGTPPTDKFKFAMYWAGSCGGCEIAVLETKDKILELDANYDVVFWPVAADFKYKDVRAYDDGFIDVCLFNGCIRNSGNEEIAHLLRQKSKVLVAFGACATMRASGSHQRDDGGQLQARLHEEPVD